MRLSTGRWGACRVCHCAVVAGDGLALLGLGGCRVGRRLDEAGQAPAVGAARHRPSLRAAGGRFPLGSAAGAPGGAGVGERLAAPGGQQGRQRAAFVLGCGLHRGPPADGVDPAQEDLPLGRPCGRCQSPGLVVDLTAQMTAVGGDRGQGAGVPLGDMGLVRTEVGQQTGQCGREGGVGYVGGEFHDRSGAHDGHPPGQVRAAPQHTGGRPCGPHHPVQHPGVGDPGQERGRLRPQVLVVRGGDGRGQEHAHGVGVHRAQNHGRWAGGSARARRSSRSRQRPVFGYADDTAVRTSSSTASAALSAPGSWILTQSGYVVDLFGSARTRA
ncbi:hypothetical protein [Streptomyces sp. NPDC001435]|uniref:hypothetical protein n=1 Tax=Streptomyces sp. NPDC001435 TaxID=3364576 RepID=UPI0036CEC237